MLSRIGESHFAVLPAQSVPAGASEATADESLGSSGLALRVVGQRVVVFLGVNGPQVPYILGLNQGVYRVDVDTAGQAFVSPPPVMPGVTGPVVRGASSRQPAPLAVFEREVRSAAGDAR